ncbi:MAG: hypothetical protein O9972_30995 [Burkholderiales bacterium]|nr:hypothetical protein [Burkholderiales bacterium]
MTPRNNLGVGPRCATWLKEVYPANRGKLIARDFRVSESTAWRWLAGEAPTVRVLEEMGAKWGRPFLNYVFAGSAGPAGDDLQRLMAIRDELDRREAEAKARAKEVEEGFKRYSRAAPDLGRAAGKLAAPLPAIDCLDPHALKRAAASDLRALMTHLLERKLAADPPLTGSGKTLLTLRALLRIT